MRRIAIALAAFWLRRGTERVTRGRTDRDRSAPSHVRRSRAVAGVSMGAWGAMLLGLKHPQLFGAIGALSAPFGISRQDPNMDMASRTQQRFGAPETIESSRRSVPRGLSGIDRSRPSSR